MTSKRDQSKKQTYFEVIQIHAYKRTQTAGEKPSSRRAKQPNLSLTPFHCLLSKYSSKHTLKDT